MKARAVVNELRGLSVEELEAKAKGYAEELLKLRARRVTSTLEQTHRVSEAKKNLARARTILREKGRQQGAGANAA